MAGAGGGERDDTAAAAAAFGIPAAEVAALIKAEPDQCLIWPENLPAAQLFAKLLTQWRVGMGGLVGLDYAAVPLAGQCLGLRRGALRRALAGVQVMEAEALAWAREQE